MELPDIGTLSLASKAHLAAERFASVPVWAQHRDRDLAATTWSPQGGVDAGRQPAPGLKAALRPEVGEAGR